ncbi:MAG: ribosome-binding factor A [Deltaproteobacteria bacterium RIFOXYD12_FULL_50_9]|nr:MAG: ribosome-binding factor A [Deltaproteobacteria bacterium RIFOXYD12_FULL_50_9]
MPGGDRGGKRRSQRVSDVILSEVAMLLLKTITDPRLKRLTLTSVRMTEDLRIARVFFDCNEENAAQVQAGLDSAKGFIRSHLARALKLRIAPDLEFRRDLSIVRQEEMERILKEIREDNDSDSG